MVVGGNGQDMLTHRGVSECVKEFNYLGEQVMAVIAKTFQTKQTEAGQQ